MSNAKITNTKIAKIKDATEAFWRRAIFEMLDGRVAFLDRVEGMSLSATLAIPCPYCREPAYHPCRKYRRNFDNAGKPHGQILEVPHTARRYEARDRILDRSTGLGYRRKHDDSETPKQPG